MLAFSFTAPRISKDDELRERATLNEQDLEEIKQDMYGNHGANEVFAVDGPSTMAVLRDLEHIDVSNKEDYLEALKRCPELVKEESNIEAFLQCEKGDVSCAASRLVQYWRMRKFLFGERAFLPMTWEKGALVEEDRQVLKLGVYNILPSDKHGRGVLFIDMDKLRAMTKVEDRKRMVRAAFYTLQIMKKNPSVRANGVVVVSTIKMDTPTNFNRKLYKLLWDCIGNAAPLYIRAFHAVNQSFIMDLMLQELKHFIGKKIRLRLKVHKVDTARAVLGELETYKLQTSKLPVMLGGTYNEVNNYWVGSKAL